MCQFFFSNIKSVHLKYKAFFGTDDQDEQDVDEDVETPTQMAPSEATARFYFELTYRLANDDITKIMQIENTNVYLCLNTASLIKDRIVKEQNELKKLKNEIKTNR